MRSWHQANFLFISGFHFLLSLTGLVVLLDYFPGRDEYLLAALGLVCALPGLFSWYSHKFEFFEPVYPVVISTFFYYCFQPVFFLSDGTFNFLGVNLQPELPKVTLLALLGLLGFYVGYYAPQRQTHQTNSSTSWTQSDLREVRHYALVIFTLFVTLVILWIVTARIPLWSLWVFGEADYGTAWEYSGGPQIGYLHGARNALPACILLLFATRSRRRWSSASLLAAIVISVILAGMGGRFRALLALGTVWMFAHLEVNKRPSIRQLIVIGATALFLIGLIGSYRGGGRAIGQSRFGWNEVRDSIVYSSRLALSSAVTVREVPKYRPYNWGIPYLNILTQPIPRFIWPDKSQFFPNLLGLSATPRDIEIELVRWGGMAAPFWIHLYGSFGPVGIILGMVVAGWLCRKVYLNYQSNPNDPFAQIYLTLFWFFVFQAYGRGSPSFIFTTALTIFVPVWMMHRLLSRRRQGHNRTCLKQSLSRSEIIAG